MVSQLEEISWKGGTLLVREFEDNNYATHYSVEGWKRDKEENYSLVPIRIRGNCKAFLRGHRHGTRIHFRNGPKRRPLKRSRIYKTPSV